MALSNTAVPKYYGMFRDAVLRGKIPICREIELEMNRIDELIADPGIYYDDEAVEGWIRYCEGELTLQTLFCLIHSKYGRNRFLDGITTKKEASTNQTPMDMAVTMLING